MAGSPRSPSPMAAPGEEDERKCRICFEEEEEEGNSLISPCVCQGSQRYVHEKCLREWQRSVIMQRPNHPDQETAEQRHIVCNVCRQNFTVPAPSRITVLEELSGLTSAQIRCGTLLVATNCHEVPFSPDIPAHWQALFEARRAHWLRSVYLLCSVSGPAGDAEFPAASDQVLGINLSRNTDLDPRSSSYASNVREEALGALDSIGFSADLSFYIGGPVAPQVGHAVGRVTAEGVDHAAAYGVSVVSTGADGEGLIFGKIRAVLQCCAEHGSSRYFHHDRHGCPAPEGAEGACAGEGRRHIRVFHGHATWRRQQLLGEITRGSWGLIDLADTSLFALHVDNAAQIDDDGWGCGWELEVCSTNATDTSACTALRCTPPHLLPALWCMCWRVRAMSADVKCDTARECM